MSTTDLALFFSWFQSRGGSIDVSSINIINFPASEGGRGAVALRDIPEGHTLFTIPRSLTLSTRTSLLPSHFGLETWKERRLHEGWVGLILCMMWEGASGPSSKWSEYLATLPSQFDTPMFWNKGDLTELRGTSVVEKLGREEAEKDYNEKLIPAIESRPDLFSPAHIPVHYSLEAYHMMGSRVLSRSFGVEKWDLGVENVAANTSHGSGMDVDLPEHGAEKEEEEKEEEEEEEEEDSSDTTMIPMADMLNARYESENAKLFHEEHELKMVSTKPIKAGEQIWNTYGDLPNAELLRRYGHVDLLPLPQGGAGNPGDVVEIRADLAVAAAARCRPALSPESSRERIDWWLEEGGDDTFVLEFDLELPLAMISIIRLLLLPAGEWEKARDKGKPPKPKADQEVLVIMADVLVQRMKEYATTLKEDEDLLFADASLNKRHAIIVRMGEKRILEGTLDKIRVLQAAEAAKEDVDSRKNKRKGEAVEAPIAKSKKSRQ